MDGILKDPDEFVKDLSTNRSSNIYSFQSEKSLLLTFTTIVLSNKYVI